MDPSADAEAFLLGLEKDGDAGTTEGQAQPSAELNHAGTAQMNGQVSDGIGNGTAASAANGYTSSGRRNKWGAIMEVKEEPPKPQKKRRSRWEEVPEENTDTTLAVVPKEITICGGIRVYLPSALTGGPQSSDPKVRELNNELNEVNRKILNNDLEIPPEGERSPSPEPIYDRNGIRLNTREVRVKERLMERRNYLIEELIKADHTYRPPADYRPAKKHRKVYIPQKDYPGYNFIGLIIGPRGNTQKRMQKETNTKIAIRGKGSVKEGAARDPKYDYGEEEELHVLITGDKMEDVNSAAEMIEELLVPTDEARNEHKRLQLQELAALNGTLKDDQHCYLCGQNGHRQFECPNQPDEVYKLPNQMQEKVQAQYERDIVRMAGPGEAPPKMDDEYKSFLAELGGGPGDGGGPPSGGMRGMSGGGGGPRSRPGDDLPDSCKLYVGNLSPAVTDTVLKSLMEPFGNVLHAVVLLDMTSGQSRGFGFVHMDNAESASNAAAGMNGKPMDGRPLVVRLRSEGPDKRGGGGFDRPRGGGFGPMENDESKLYVAHLDPRASEEDVRQLFSNHGNVLHVRIIQDRDTGMSKGYGFVTMAAPNMAQDAANGLNGYKVGEKTLVVKMAGSRGPPSGPGGPPMGGPGFGTAPPRGPPGGAAPPRGPPPGAGGPPGYGMPPPGYGAPPAQAPPFYGHMPPQQPMYGMPPPGYGAPPPGYAPPYGAPPGYGAPGYGAPAPPAPGYGAYGAPPQQPSPYQPPVSGYGGQAAAATGANAYMGGGASSAQPPLPSEPPPEQQVQSEYERFMAEVQSK
ncbi:hypothetical protein CVIRNUC_006527 [Coccomyxa viridis]|uniref:Branchpoint-bridging protein n=1 Tax=Coccomyxa viridis TaxID=1274662 RepID=A0AAV1IBV7_9CHLO|nr:hypothetical protein CVIRNUC_006527 [Coccomyxa viridis]